MLDGGVSGNDDDISKQVLVLTSDSPTGKFVWNQRISMYDYTGGTTNTGDQTVFVDEDTQKAYLVYSYGRGRGKIFISEIVDQGEGKYGPSLEKTYKVYDGPGREGDCMFKYNGAYYVCGSDLYGWNASHAYYLKLDSLQDDYLKTFKAATSMEVMPGCSDDFCHVTQTGFFYTVKREKQETVIFCGDRWAAFAHNGLGFNQWCPLSFDDKGTPYFNSLSAWHLDEKTGEWSVADDNNYVKNGSFDADRVSQTTLAGWTNKITKGAPVKNSENSTSGKYGLALTDKNDFAGEVSQTIEPSYVTIPDGTYTMTANVKNSADFTRLQMYAKSGSLKKAVSFKEVHDDWTQITLSDIEVTGNRAEIGFTAEGAAGASCYIDDVAFVKSEVQGKRGTISGTVTADADAAGKILTISAAQTDSTYEYFCEVEMKEGQQDFTIQAVAEGSYTLSASAPGCVVDSKGTDITVGENQTSGGVEFTITNNTGSIKGNVTDDQNAPLEGVTVILKSSNGEDSLTVATDGEGEYVFSDIMSGEYSLAFEKKGYAREAEDEEVTVTVKKGQETAVNTQKMVQCTGTIAGTVTDVSGNPVTGASVALRCSDSIKDATRETVETDESGSFRFEDKVVGSYTISASQGKWDASVNAIEQNVAVAAKKETKADLRLPEEVTIVNGGFEDGNLTGWKNTGTGGKASNQKNRGHVYSGTYGYTAWNASPFTIDLEQAVPDLENGVYVVQVTIAAGAFDEPSDFYLYAKNGAGEIIAKENIPNTANGKWELVGLKANVTDGELSFGVHGAMPGSAWVNMDDFRVGKVTEDVKPEKTLASIRIAEGPAKTAYETGEELELDACFYTYCRRTSQDRL